MIWTRPDFDEWISQGAPNAIAKNVTELNMPDSNLTTLSPNIGKLTKLIALDLDNNQLTSIPKEIANLKELEHLFMDNNLLTTLPPNITSDYISVRNNKIIKLPSNINAHEGLYLHGNRLTTLEPLNLRNLKHLIVLELTNNLLTSLPSNINQLETLEALYIYDNPSLTVLPSSIILIKSLVVLDWRRDAHNYTMSDLAQCGNKDGPISGEPLKSGTLLVRAKIYDSENNQIPEYDCYNRESLAHWFKANPKRVNPLTREPFNIEFFAENGGFYKPESETNYEDDYDNNSDYDHEYESPLNHYDNNSDYDDSSLFGGKRKKIKHCRRTNVKTSKNTKLKRKIKIKSRKIRYTTNKSKKGKKGKKGKKHSRKRRK